MNKCFISHNVSNNIEYVELRTHTRSERENVEKQTKHETSTNIHGVIENTYALCERAQERTIVKVNVSVHIGVAVNSARVCKIAAAAEQRTSSFGSQTENDCVLSVRPQPSFIHIITISSHSTVVVVCSKKASANICMTNNASESATKKIYKSSAVIN